MKKPGNRERILKTSVDLFNLHGVAALSTNHIAQHLRISPGNLYFHFRNKEEILRELFKQMCDSTYKAWQPVTEKKMMLPEQFIREAMEVFWTYRFFHREMYFLKRQDPELALQWKKHIQKTLRLIKMAYHQWIRAGLMVRMRNADTLQSLSDTVLFTGSAYMNFYESPDKPANKKAVGKGAEHVLRLLAPYLE